MLKSLYTILLPILLQAQPDPGALDAIFRNAYPADQPGASVLVVKDGTVLLHQGYGFADVANYTAMQPNSIHKIGSITKQFTAIAVLRLVHEGKLDLDQTVEDVVPGLLAYGNTVTIRHLLTHTSGIPSYTNQPTFIENMGKADWSTLDILRLTSAMEPEFAAGESYNYNNSAYVLLAEVIEQASGMSYARYVETVMAPLAGLTSTVYGTDATVKASGTVGYSPSPNGYVVAQHIDMSFPGAAGSLLSTVTDLYKWTVAVDAGKLLPKSYVDEAWTSATLNNGDETGYGYGWSLSDWQGKRIVAHGGGIPGFVTFALWLPEEKVFVAVLGNRDGGNPNPEMLAYEAMGEALGMPLYPEASPLSAEQAKDYAGVYQVDESARRIITVDGTQVKSQRTGSSVFDIVYIGEDTFYYPGSLSRVSFTRDSNGVVDGMLFSSGGGAPARALKVDEEIPSGPVEITIDPTIFDAYSGEYELAPGFTLTVWRDGDAFWTQATGQSAFNIYPESETRFFLKVTPATIEFSKNDAGEVTHLTLYQAGQVMPAQKVN